MAWVWLHTVLHPENYRLASSRQKQMFVLLNALMTKLYCMEPTKPGWLAGLCCKLVHIYQGSDVIPKDSHKKEPKDQLPSWKKELSEKRWFFTKQKRVSPWSCYAQSGGPPSLLWLRPLCCDECSNRYHPLLWSMPGIDEQIARTNRIAGSDPDVSSWRTNTRAHDSLGPRAFPR